MGRGPSYPYIGLEEAIAMTRKVYDHARRAPAQLESVITEAWKYSPSSSGSQKVIAALRAFGLIEDAPGTNGKSIKLTQRSVRILLDTEDTPEKKEEIRKAALSPKWYDYCWKVWGREMPPSMRSNLLIEHGFVESTIDEFLKNYKKTVAFAGLMDGAGTGSEGEDLDESGNSIKIGDYVQWESQGILRMPESRRLTHYSPDGKFAFVEGSPVGIPDGELIPGEAPEEKPPAVTSTFSPVVAKNFVQGDVKMQVETFALPEGVTGQLQWPTAMTAEAYEDFIYQLEGLKRRVNRAVTKPSIEGAPKDEG